ncbi:MAG: SET domain-containing protein [Rhodothermaceae bacterium]|nr:SET domain-containing protein [Rhodothermaceae bacterium]
MIHPHTRLRFISEAVGYGVVATERIPKGTITWAKDPLDQTLGMEAVEALGPAFRPHLDHFTYRDNRGDYVLCWDHGRYINHSAFPNCITTAYNFELAVRDIEPGEELTNDYGFLNLEYPFEAFPEPGTDRTRILPDDLLRHHDRWDGQLRDAFRHFNTVEQLLAFLGPLPTLETARSIGNGAAEMDSIQSFFYADGALASA